MLFIITLEPAEPALPLEPETPLEPEDPFVPLVPELPTMNKLQEVKVPVPTTKSDDIVTDVEDTAVIAPSI